MEDTETPADTPDTPAEAPAEAEAAPEGAAYSPLDEADRINKEKKINLDREEGLLARREKLVAEERVGGRAIMGKPDKPELTDAEKASAARVQQIGEAAGAQWAKPKTD